MVVDKLPNADAKSPEHENAGAKIFGAHAPKIFCGI
jgi:hypothetical protein